MILGRLKECLTKLDPRLLFKKKDAAGVEETIFYAEERPPHPDKDWVLKLVDNAVRFSTWGCLAFLALYCLKFVGKVKFDIKIDWSNTQPFTITYDLATSLDLLPLAALAFVSIGIVCFAKAWVTLFAEEPFSNWVTKWGSLLLGIATSVVIVMGSMTVNQDVRQEDYRAALVTEEKAQNSKAGEQARIDLKKEELARMQAKPSYQGLAASAGEKSWSEKIAMTPETDVNYKQISRAITDAKAADALKAEIEALTVALAAGTTTAEVKADVGAEMHDDVTSMVRQSVVWRMPLMAAVMDIILIFGPFMAKNRRKRMLKVWATWQPSTAPGMQRMRASDLEYPFEDFIPKGGANAQKEPAPNAQGAEKPQAQADPSTQETGDPQSGNETEKPSPDPAPGEEAPNRESGVEETTTRKTTEVETHTRRVFQRKLRPATLEELKAAGLVLEEPANDPVERPEGSGDEPKASEGMDEGGMDPSGSGPDSVPPVPETGVDSGQSDLLTDEQPEVEDSAEAPEGPQQGTEEPARTEGDPVDGNKNEEAA